MTTQNSNSATPNRVSANGLMAVNLVTALTVTLFLAVLLFATLVGSDERGWASFVFLVSIVVSLAGAMICVWQNHIAAQAMDLVIWIITGVSLFFGFMSLLTAVILIMVGAPRG